MVDPWYGTPSIDEIERVMGSDRVRHPVHGSDGGEWDALRALSKYEKRILTGARYLTPTGLFPDQAADIICAQTNCSDTDEAMEWYVEHALGAVLEARRLAYDRRTYALARRHGFDTYHQLRTAQAVAEGFHTYREKRRQRGWTG